MGSASSPIGFVMGRWPILALSSVSGKMNLHAFLSLLLNHPITWVGFALIFSMTMSGISITILFRFMAHLGFYRGQELECKHGKKLYLTGWENYVWVQFYNPPCQYSPGNLAKLEDAWKQWTTSFKDCLLHLRQLEVAFIPAGAADLTSEVLPAIKNLSKYGGVMLWLKCFDDLTGFSSSNKNDV
ncbi:acidic endochitinase [Quercus suber]|uniref:Acidic endochitinase n=1 Tax=Quercus suber TaxID=58331 RepID=A0AAW0LHV0_QUESU